MKHRFMIGLIVLALGACSDKTGQVVPEALALEPVGIDSLLLGKCYGMLLVDSNLLVADSQGDSLFHWVNLNRKTCKDAGSIGQGPGEYLDFDGFYAIDGKYGFYDSNLRCASDISFSPESVSLHKKFTLESTEYRYYKMVPTAWGTYIGTGPYRKGAFAFTDSIGRFMKVTGEQPYRDENERKIPEIARAMAYQGHLAVSPDGKRMARAIYTSPMIYFYYLHPDDAVLVSSHIERYPEYRPELGKDSYASAMNRKNKLGYVELAATDRHVYALFSGKSTEEAGLSALSGSIIRVFDWEGILLKEYTCDTYMTTFCVSPDDRTLYAVGLADDYALLKAELEI